MLPKHHREKATVAAAVPDGRRQEGQSRQVFLLLRRPLSPPTCLAYAEQPRWDSGLRSSWRQKVKG